MKKLLLKIYSAICSLYQKKQKHIRANIVKLSENELLLGRSALITGGTSGIGFAVADAFLNAGAEAVVITGRSEERCIDAANKLNSIKRIHNGKAFYQVLDVKAVDTFEENLKKILDKIEGRQISILCNNAGVQGAQFGKATVAEYDNVMETNYKGAFFLSQLVAKYMIENKIEGNIINIASSSSLRPTNSAYSLSKACIKEFTAGLSKFLIPYGIVVNGVAPGPTATPLMNKNEDSTIEHPTNPSGRYALPDEIGNMVVVLCSGIGRMIVGDIVYMTGGAGITTFDDSRYIF